MARTTSRSISCTTVPAPRTPRAAMSWEPGVASTAGPCASNPAASSSLFANGLRSPASVGAGPDGRVWYADNQGDFVASSKLFVLQKDKFYGHPAGLVDLPGMTPDSPEIKYDNVAARRERPVILFPHNRVANSPGNPAWVPKKKLGPFAGQMLIGDQTQSNLLRVAFQKVGDVEQGSVMPFFEGLESGVMRPVFLPDGSLLLGQTGRGWQAKGGKVASLQHVRWDGKTVAPQIVAMLATPAGLPHRSHAAAGRWRERGDPAFGVVAGIVGVSRCAGLWLARAGSSW